jgi:hypothetical protein
MEDKFGDEDSGQPTVQALLNLTAAWDYVVINDYTQGPAREEKRTASKQVLKDEYGPALVVSGGIPVFLQTAAYREPVKDSEDLGTVHEFTQLLSAGYQEYADLMEDILPANQKPLIAPVGDAYLYLYEYNREIWQKLFYVDDFHPSPLGTWLQACILYSTITKEAPPIYNADWWKEARFMMPRDKVQLAVPTTEEAEVIRTCACNICDILDENNQKCRLIV